MCPLPVRYLSATCPQPVRYLLQVIEYQAYRVSATCPLPVSYLSATRTVRFSFHEFEKSSNLAAAPSPQARVSCYVADSLIVDVHPKRDIGFDVCKRPVFGQQGYEPLIYWYPVAALHVLAPWRRLEKISGKDRPGYRSLSDALSYP